MIIVLFLLFFYLSFYFIFFINFLSFNFSKFNLLPYEFEFYFSVYNSDDNYGGVLREKIIIKDKILPDVIKKLDYSNNSIPTYLKVNGSLLSNLVGIPYLDRFILKGLDLVKFIDLDSVESLDELESLLPISSNSKSFINYFSSVNKVFPVYLNESCDYGLPIDLKLDDLFIIKDLNLVDGRIFYSRKRWHRFFISSFHHSINSKLNNFRFLWKVYLRLIMLRKLGRSRGFKSLNQLNLFRILSNNLGRAFWYFNHTNSSTSIISVLALAHAIKLVINPSTGIVENIIFDWSLYLGFMKYYFKGFEGQTNETLSHFIEEIIIINEDCHPYL